MDSMTVLSRSGLAGQVSRQDCLKLAAKMHAKTYETGAVIVQEGDVGTEMFFVSEGSAVAQKNSQVVKTYGAGEYFGELSLLRRAPRAATVIATSRSTVWILMAADFKLIEATAAEKASLLYGSTSEATLASDWPLSKSEKVERLINLFQGELGCVQVSNEELEQELAVCKMERDQLLAKLRRIQDVLDKAASTMDTIDIQALEEILHE
jgi:CRP-like cAMP-binding protein